MHSKARPEARAHAYDLPTTLYLLPSASVHLLQCRPTYPSATLHPLPSVFLLPSTFYNILSILLRPLSPAIYPLPAPRDATTLCANACRLISPGHQDRRVAKPGAGPQVPKIDLRKPGIDLRKDHQVAAEPCRPREEETTYSPIAGQSNHCSPPTCKI